MDIRRMAKLDPLGACHLLILESTHRPDLVSQVQVLFGRPLLVSDIKEAGEMDFGALLFVEVLIKAYIL